MKQITESSNLTLQHRAEGYTRSTVPLQWNKLGHTTHLRMERDFNLHGNHVHLQLNIALCSSVAKQLIINSKVFLKQQYTKKELGGLMEQVQKSEVIWLELHRTYFNSSVLIFAALVFKLLPNLYCRCYRATSKILTLPYRTVSSSFCFGA